ncbi:MAG: hypothetical protein J6X37_07570 [Treponema sp.]|uniref:hypothetical protein n=1 Tax=Treponema sp. TaxID=166 RepID=UPI001B54D508|nr:hypothetical protein [Treponema sp.]MBP5588565.1 hypothetical protein [Treponema sp.]MCR5385871.1 hypothetical protein [Treponema sp.]
MGRNDRRNRRNYQNQNQNQRQNQPKINPENLQEIQNKEAAIREFKSRDVVCAKCGKPIEDMTSAISDAEGKPMHFDCVLENLKSKEKMLPGQQMTYIGNGRFAVVTFENPRDLRKFKIEKVIEYEDKSKPISWRNEMAELYSQVK